MLSIATILSDKVAYTTLTNEQQNMYESIATTLLSSLGFTVDATDTMQTALAYTVLDIIEKSNTSNLANEKLGSWSVAYTKSIATGSNSLPPIVKSLLHIEDKACAIFNRR